MTLAGTLARSSETAGHSRKVRLQAPRPRAEGQDVSACHARGGPVNTLHIRTGVFTLQHEGLSSFPRTRVKSQVHVSSPSDGVPEARDRRIPGLDCWLIQPARCSSKPMRDLVCPLTSKCICTSICSPVHTRTPTWAHD